MSRLLLLVLFAVSEMIYAGNLIPVESSPNNMCKPRGCTYYEWIVKGAENIRYVASEYKDGIDYSLYEVTDDGEYKLLLRVNPIVLDRDGKYWRGYPSSTKDIDITVSNGKALFLASFDHDIVRDDNIEIPEWQSRLPALLLIGNRGDWNVAQKRYTYKKSTIEELVAKARKPEWSLDLRTVGPWGPRHGIYADSDGTVGLAPGWEDIQVCRSRGLNESEVNKLVAFLAGVPNEIPNRSTLRFSTRCTDQNENFLTVKIGGTVRHFVYTQNSECLHRTDVPSWLSQILKLLWSKHEQIRGCEPNA